MRNDKYLLDRHLHSNIDHYLKLVKSNLSSINNYSKQVDKIELNVNIEFLLPFVRIIVLLDYTNLDNPNRVSSMFFHYNLYFQINSVWYEFDLLNT